MKKIKKENRILTVLLVSVIVLSFCSCGVQKEEETTTSGSISTTYFAAPVTSVTSGEDSEALSSEPTGTEPSETVTQVGQTETQTEQVTQTEQAAQETETGYLPTTEENTQPVIATGTQTVADGNKTIVYPAAIGSVQGTYPVIAWANGTGCPTQLYIKLIEAIANAGYIVVADSTVMSGDGTAQIDSINYIIGKNADSSSIFYNKVDTFNIGVCGQSQGGRSCINAAQNDSRIRAVVSIAGASTADEASGLSIPCLFLTATNDNIVKSDAWVLPSYNAVTGRAAYASLKGGNHLSFNSMSGYTIDWFNAYLKNDSNAKSVFADGGKLSTDTNWQDFKNKN